MGMTLDRTPETGSEPWRICEIDWQYAWRVVPTRFPAINLFDRVANAEDFDALYALEALTNDRVRSEVGRIGLVPANERLYGPGSGPIMAALTHPNPFGSRFSNGTFGVFYCARERRTAIAETRYHAARFLAATHEPPMRQQMRLYRVDVRGAAVDLRHADDQTRYAAVLSTDSYAASQLLAEQVRAAGHAAIAYPSVRDDGLDCLAAFRTSALRNCLHESYLEYGWNGESIDTVFELRQLV
jgi:RES domain